MFRKIRDSATIILRTFFMQIFLRLLLIPFSLL
jgi:hypothetical protein